MILQYRCPVIIMLTRLVDNYKVLNCIEHKVNFIPSAGQGYIFCVFFFHFKYILVLHKGLILYQRSYINELRSNITSFTMQFSQTYVEGEQLFSGSIADGS